MSFPSLPIVRFNSVELSKSSGTPTSITAHIPIFSVYSSDIAGEVLSYKLSIFSNQNNTNVFESEFQSAPTFQIDGLSTPNIVYRIDAEVKNLQGNISISNYYISFIESVTGTVYLENTPIVLHDCENATNVTGYGMSVDATSTFCKQGTRSLSFDMENNAARKTVQFTMPTAINPTNNTIRFWLNFAYPIKIKTKANGGIVLRIMDSSSRYRDYRLDGSDTYFGGWKLYQVNDWANYDYQSNAAFTLNSIKYIQIIIDVIVTVTSEDNLWIDHLTMGSSYNVTSVGNINLDMIAAADKLAGWGILSKEDGIFKLSGSITFGYASSARDCNLIQNDAVIVTTKNSKVISNHHNILVEKNTTSITFGDIVNDTGMNGISFICGDGTANFIINSAANVNLFGCKFQNFTTITGYLDTLNVNGTDFVNVYVLNQISGNVKKSVFTNCQLQVSPSGSTIIEGCTFKSNSIGLVVNATDGYIQEIIDCVFIGNTYDVASYSTTNSITIKCIGISNPKTTYNTVTIVTPRRLSIVGVKPNTEVRIYNASNNELIGVENMDAGGIMNYDYNYSVDIPVRINIHNIQYIWQSIDHILGNSDFVMQVHQELDRANEIS